MPKIPLILLLVAAIAIIVFSLINFSHSPIVYTVCILMNAHSIYKICEIWNEE